MGEARSEVFLSTQVVNTVEPGMLETEDVSYPTIVRCPKFKGEKYTKCCTGRAKVVLFVRLTRGFLFNLICFTSHHIH